jgi:hypothetical protein
VRRRRSRRKAVGTRTPILVEAKPNARWSLDFDGRALAGIFASLHSAASISQRLVQNLGGGNAMVFNRAAKKS